LTCCTSFYMVYVLPGTQQTSRRKGVNTMARYWVFFSVKPQQGDKYFYYYGESNASGDSCLIRSGAGDYLSIPLSGLVVSGSRIYGKYRDMELSGYEIAPLCADTRLPPTRRATLYGHSQNYIASFIPPLLGDGEKLPEEIIIREFISSSTHRFVPGMTRTNCMWHCERSDDGLSYGDNNFSGKLFYFINDDFLSKGITKIIMGRNKNPRVRHPLLVWKKLESGAIKVSLESKCRKFFVSRMYAKRRDAYVGAVDIVAKYAAFRKNRASVPKPPESGRYLKRFVQKMSDIVCVHKKPQTDAPHIGIEIECFGPLDRTNLIKEIIARNAHLCRSIYVTSDGSIRPGEGKSPIEVCFLSEYATYKQPLRELLDLLRKLDYRVNRSCGLHVHIDQRHHLKETGVDMPGIRRTFSNLVAAHRVLVETLPFSRRNNKFCLENTTIAVGREFGTRYKMVNARALLKHKTIEVRSHSATLDFDKIWPWVDTLHDVASFGEVIERAPRSIWHLFERMGIKDARREYFDARRELFLGKKDADEDGSDPSDLGNPYSQEREASVEEEHRLSLEVVCRYVPQETANSMSHEERCDFVMALNLSSEFSLGPRYKDTGMVDVFKLYKMLFNRDPAEDAQQRTGGGVKVGRAQVVESTVPRNWSVRRRSFSELYPWDWVEVRESDIRQQPPF
jgi:hypothetical protein